VSKKREQRRSARDVLPAIAEPERKVPRRLRVEGELFEQLSLAVLSLEDPRVSAVSVTRVQMTDDLQLVRVFVHLLGSDADEPRQREILRGLRSASGRLRRMVGETLELRYVPELRFFYDTGVDNARRVEELLDEVKREEEER
jgi:ribosome-binding factor A